MALRLKRVYDAPESDDGLRVLVDRLWPRGLTKDAAHVDLWLKDIAPSNELRKRFGHAPEKWEDFKAEYFAELDGNPAAVAELRSLAKKQAVTLVFSAKNTEFNNAVALKEFLNRKGSKPCS